MNKSSFLDKNNFWAIAHRGANLLAPENTIEAFTAAVNLGFEYLETDVRASIDGVPFIMHDANLSRMTGENLDINSLTSDDIDSIKINGTSWIRERDSLL